jgi:hypothetical protein
MRPKFRPAGLIGNCLVAVEYSPYVTLHYQPHTMYEGDALHFKCTAEANPPEMAFR